MALDQKKALKALSPRSVWFTVLIGLTLVALVAIQDEGITEESFWLVAKISPLAILFALLMLALKDGLNTARVKHIGSKSFSWKSALYIVFLWEFSIAVTPPLVGPMALVVFILHKEGAALGKALAYAMLLAIMDNFFFLTATPFVWLLSQGQVFPSNHNFSLELGGSLNYFFFLSYGMVMGYTLFMSASILFFPRGIKVVLYKVSQLNFLSRWRKAIQLRADELFEAAHEFRGKRALFWLKLVVLTYGVWLVKYFVLNVIIFGFEPWDMKESMLLVGRHLVMWVVMLASPTPGSAGTAEYLFPAFFGEFLGEYTFAASLAWRLTSFYPYLIIGALILPNWIKKVVG